MPAAASTALPEKIRAAIDAFATGLSEENPS
jgi:hypothetical protein